MGRYVTEVRDGSFPAPEHAYDAGADAAAAGGESRGYLADVENGNDP